MNPETLFSSHSAVIFGCVLPCLAVIFLSAYAAASSRYHCNYKLLELRLDECQTNSRIAEKEHALTRKETDAQLLSLVSANEELQQQLLALERINEELSRAAAQKEAEYVKRRSALEEVWLKERENILRAKDQATVSSQANLRGVETICISRSRQIQALTQTQEELREECRQQEQKNWELTDKLSECFRRLEDKGAPLVTPFTQLRPLYPPSYAHSIKHDTTRSFMSAQ